MHATSDDMVVDSLTRINSLACDWSFHFISFRSTLSGTLSIESKVYTGWPKTESHKTVMWQSKCFPIPVLHSVPGV
jgi:hypothetical protein